MLPGMKLCVAVSVQWSITKTTSNTLCSHSNFDSIVSDRCNLLEISMQRLRELAIRIERIAHSDFNLAVYRKFSSGQRLCNDMCGWSVVSGWGCYCIINHINFPRYLYENWENKMRKKCYQIWEGKFYII